MSEMAVLIVGIFDEFGKNNGDILTSEIFILLIFEHFNQPHIIFMEYQVVKNKSVDGIVNLIYSVYYLRE